MKRCPTCFKENADEMRFCVYCGTPLPDPPMIVNLGGQSGQSNFGNPMGTPTGHPGGFQNPPNFSNLPPPKPKKGKALIIFGGIFALLFLLGTVGAVVIGYNILLKERAATTTPTATPTASPTPSETPTKSPTKSPTPEKTSTPEKPDSSSMRAVLKDIKVDYDAVRGGETGMEIDVDYEVRGMKGVRSYLALYFSKQNGEKLYSNNDAYRASDGTLALFSEMNPGFDATEYKDTILFMPYNEIPLGRGEHKLQFSVEVIYYEGGRIKHMRDYPFIFKVGK